MLTQACSRKRLPLIRSCQRGVPERRAVLFCVCVALVAGYVLDPSGPTAACAPPQRRTRDLEALVDYQRDLEEVQRTVRAGKAVTFIDAGGIIVHAVSGVQDDSALLESGWAMGERGVLKPGNAAKNGGVELMSTVPCNDYIFTADILHA